MTTPSQMLRARRRNRLLLLGGLVLVGAMSLAAGCSSIESQAFSDGDCVAGGCTQTGASSSSGAGTSSSAASSSSSSGACIVNQACSVSWSTDIYAGIFQTNVGCTNATLCHGSPASKGGITMDMGMATAAYGALNSYSLLAVPGPVKKYLAPCDKFGSGMLCNMLVDDGAGNTTNPFGTCGSEMPKGGVHKLTPAQLTTIADWITCGAPEN